MRIAVIGGGPGGLYFSVLAQQLARQTGDPHEITVWERNAADDTFGFGVVFSDETLGGIEHADPVDPRGDAARVRALGRHRRALQGRGRHQWRPRLRGDVAASGCWRSCRSAAPSSASTVHFPTEAPDVDELAATYDLVVACDGLNSAVRARVRRHLPADARRARDCKYMWLGTDKVFDAFKFYVAQTPYGVMQIHGYPFDATGSTFIVEMNDAGVGAGRLRRARRPAVRARRVRREVDRAGPRALRRRPRRARGAGQQLAVDQLHHRPQRALACTTTSSCSATPRTPRTSRSAPAPSWRWRTRWRWRPACTRSPTSADGARGVRDRAQGRSCSRRSGRRRPASSGSRTSASTSTRSRCSSRSTS